MPSLLFTIPTGTDRCIRNRSSKHRWSYLLMPFERAEIQIPVNKHECPQRLSFSPGNLFWGSFTNHNTGNYLRHGINITTNQRLSPTFRGNGNTIIVGDSQTSPLPIFPEGGRTSVHRLIQTLRVECKVCLSHAGGLRWQNLFLVIVQSAITSKQH